MSQCHIVGNHMTVPSTIQAILVVYTVVGNRLSSDHMCSWVEILSLAHLTDKPRKHNSVIQEVFHVYLNKFENAVTHLFLVIFGNN